MTPHTILDKEDIHSIISKYGLGQVNSFKVLSGGSENTNYLLRLKEDRYVLTICEQKTIEEATGLANLLEHLESQNFQSSKVVRNLKKESIEVHGDKPILLKHFIDGKIVATLPDHLLQMAGKQLGKLHTIEVPDYLPQEVNYGQNHFNEVAFYAPNSPFHLWLQAISAYLKPYLGLGLPKSLIHSDLFSDNIIVSENEQTITIMDFEEAANYYRVFDIGMALVGLCSKGDRIDLRIAKLFLEGYQQELRLTRPEQEALQAFTVYAAAAMTFWRHKNFNYTKPTSRLKDHYKELQTIANFVKEIPASDFRKIVE